MSPDKLFLFISNQMSLGGNVFAGHLGLTGLKFQRSPSNTIVINRRMETKDLE